MSTSRRFTLSAAAGIVAAGAVIGAASAGMAAAPSLASSSAAGGSHLDLTPHIRVSGSTLSVSATFEGQVHSPSAAYAKADLGSYNVVIDGKSVGGADPGDLQCHGSDPLVSVSYTTHPISVSVSRGTHVITVSETYCGGDSVFHKTVATRSEVVGRSSRPTSQPPTPSPITTRVGVTG